MTYPDQNSRTDDPGSRDILEINALLQRFTAAIGSKNIDDILAYYVNDESLLVFDAFLPRQYVGAAAHRKNWESFLVHYPTTVHAEVADWKAEADGKLGCGHGIFRIAGPGSDGRPLDFTVRFTCFFRKIDGKWLASHEHVSWPVDLVTGQADFNSKP